MSPERVVIVQYEASSATAERLREAYRRLWQQAKHGQGRENTLTEQEGKDESSIVRSCVNETTGAGSHD